MTGCPKCHNGFVFVKARDYEIAARCDCAAGQRKPAHFPSIEEAESFADEMVARWERAEAAEKQQEIDF